MSDPKLIQLVKSIKDSESAKIKLYTTADQEVHLDCIFKESTAPNFFIVFPPGRIPKNLDTGKTCCLSLHADGDRSIALMAKIVEVANDRSIELTAAKTIDPASLREYFRVDLRTSITISYEATASSGDTRSWKLHGQTLDLSGTGVLGIFPDEARNKRNIFIEITLTHPQQKIACLGHVTRTGRLRGGRWHIALHFDDITQKNKDAIITNCLWEQRRQLRENVQISD
jgi:hypothetical protein